MKNTASVIIALILVSGLVTSCTQGDSSFQSKELTQYVNTFVGTGGHGHTYPGASMPFGMIQLSPDTRLDGWDGCSAYHYSDNIIYGFSHTHLSGTGCSDYGDILLMPTFGTKYQTDTLPDSDGYWYKSKFDHINENAQPGYYSVLLDDFDIRVELTATLRSGMHKYIFPDKSAPKIVVDLKHRDEVLESELRIVKDNEIEGFRRSKAWAENQHIYFVAKFSQSFTQAELFIDNILKKDLTRADGKNVKAVFSFADSTNQEIMVKVGISSVSIEGARKNLEAEIAEWNFDQIKDNAQKEWNKELNKIQVDGSSEEHKKVFYTSLYHSMLAPNLFMDVDGKYLGTDLKIHQATGYDHYTVFSLWDTYRATHPLFTITDQKRTNHFINTFISQYEQGGQLPVWELAANYTGCMIGYHSVSVIADAYMKGINGYSAEKAYEAMKHSAEQGHLGLDAYRQFGYIPADKEHESVSKTLEYAYDDWCIAQMAKSLGKQEDYKTYMQRAQFYKNIYDPATGFMRAKKNGAWWEPFNPREVNFNYTEANSWQYSFYVPHDIEGMMQLMGGSDKFSSKIDSLFTAEDKTTGRTQVDITGLIGQYAHGNEPSHHMAYLYNYSNQPWKSQTKVRQIMDELYSSQPDGLCGNEDCGQMSSWFVFSSMGFYPVCPGQDFYVIGTPLFEKCVINLENGKQFTINANNLSDKNIYIQSAELNGMDYTKSWIAHSDIMSGSELVFEMGPTPNKIWGSNPEDKPSSVIKEDLLVTSPNSSVGSMAFTKKVQVELSCATTGADIYYTTDGNMPTTLSDKYQIPIELDTSATICAIAIKEGMINSHLMTAAYKKTFWL